VKNLLADIANAKERAAKFVQHETLFDKPEKTDYSIVGQIAKDFEPYATLWITADDWQQARRKWLGDGAVPFNTIDGEAVDTLVVESYKKMGKVLKEPKFKERAPILNVANTIRAEIEEFQGREIKESKKPKVDIIRWLRQPGMKDRHWKEIANKTMMLDFEVKLMGDIDTLQLVEHYDVIKGVAENAQKEYAIELQMQRMKAD